MSGEKLGEHLVEGAVGSVDRRQRVDADFFVRLELEFLVVEFHISAGSENRGRAIARAVLVGGGAFQGNGKNNCAGLFV